VPPVDSTPGASSGDAHVSCGRVMSEEIDHSVEENRSSGRAPDSGWARLLLAAEQAVDVGALAMRRGRSHIGALIGKGDRDFATDVDLHIESEIRASLAEAIPGIPFLGEEEGGASGVGAVWVLDPIDGTINFARDLPLCTISLSLVIAGQPVLGIVDAPLLGERFVARRGGGAYLNGARIAVSEVGGLDEAIVGVADFKVGAGSEDENRVHLAVVARLARESLRVRMIGSAALDLAWLAVGRLNATVMLSNLPWDVTGGLLLVREAGGMVYDVDGSDHDSASRYTLASVPSLAQSIRGIVAEGM
jgi:myo-inositol-1(or 4)-monophosphatase